MLQEQRMKSKRGVLGWMAGALLTAGALIVLAGNGTSLQAMPFGGWGHHEQMMPLAGILHGLDLTADQKKQIAGILRTHKGELLQANQKMQDAGKSMMETVVDQDAKPEAQQAKMDALADAGKQLGKVWLTVRREAIAVLTPAQKQELGARQQKFLAKMEAHMSKRSSGQGDHLDELIDSLSR
jgi:Spy/CpxP family protein refolding chaperone